MSGPRNNLARAIDLLQPLIEERERVLEQQEKGENGEALSPENPVSSLFIASLPGSPHV